MCGCAAKQIDSEIELDVDTPYCLVCACSFVLVENNRIKVNDKKSQQQIPNTLYCTYGTRVLE